MNNASCAVCRGSNDAWGGNATGFPLNAAASHVVISITTFSKLFIKHLMSLSFSFIVNSSAHFHISGPVTRGRASMMHIREKLQQFPAIVLLPTPVEFRFGPRTTYRCVHIRPVDLTRAWGSNECTRTTKCNACSVPHPHVYKNPSIRVKSLNPSGGAPPHE